MQLRHTRRSAGHSPSKARSAGIEVIQVPSPSAATIQHVTPERCDPKLN
jgi:hypothetical protein